jgi:hypothetical protein
MEINIWALIGFLMAVFGGFVVAAYGTYYALNAARISSTTSGLVIILFTAAYSVAVTWAIMAGHTPL